ncbi:putative amidohydrolase [Rhypophila decipiens]
MEVDNVGDDYVIVSRGTSPIDATIAEKDNISGPKYLAEIDDLINNLAGSLWPLNNFIHENPELAYKEYKAHDALTSFVEAQQGWEVTRSACGMETAWIAVYDTGEPGPVVSFNAEMDALPQIGHACGHNLIAITSVAAALATSSIIRTHHLNGKVLLFGTPGEEGTDGGKIRLLNSGAYKDVDISLISHPGILHNSPMVRTTAFSRLQVSYHGRASHSANSPWLGINALDALVIAYNSISALRQQTMPGDVIAMSIIDGGGPSTNIIHEFASGACTLRAATTSRLNSLVDKIKSCFEAGGLATGAKVDIKQINGYMDHVPNRVLAASYKQYWEHIPGPKPEIGLPREGEYTYIKSSTDQGDISHKVPSVNASFAIPPGPEKGQPHSRDFEKASGTREAFETALRVAKALAGTAVDVLTQDGLLDEVKRQWRKDMEEMG